MRILDIQNLQLSLNNFDISINDLNHENDVWYIETSINRYFNFSYMVATGQEIVREKKILQGQGKVREFLFESGKIYIFEKSQGKVKF